RSRILRSGHERERHAADISVLGQRCLLHVALVHVRTAIYGRTFSGQNGSICPGGVPPSIAPRGQRNTMRAPPSSRFFALTLPPVCSTSVLAIKKPSPMPC